MAAKSTTPITPEKLVKAYVKYKSLKAVYRAQHFPGVSYKRLLAVYNEAVSLNLIERLPVGRKTKEQLKNPEAAVVKPRGQVKATQAKQFELPEPGKVKRYLFSVAQNNTAVFTPFWENLLVLAKHYKADIHIARVIYLTNGISSTNDKAQAFERMAKKREDLLNGIKPKKEEKEDFWWADEFEPYLSDERVEIAPGLVWCGEASILPTAVNPLTGFESYTGRRSGIFPHTKISMQSIPSAKHAPAKFNYTTGAVTLRNYIQRKAGMLAEFNHCYGALLAEVDSEGNWWCRQINADSEGTIYDLRNKVEGGVHTKQDGNIEAISWADIHVAQMEKETRELCWGKGGMLDMLKPRYQFFHDVLDFRAKGHHEIKHPHRQFRRYLLGETDVRKEMVDVCDFLEYAYRGDVEGIVVDSNHHDHIGRWLEEQDARWDSKNVEFWTAMQARVWASLRKGAENPNYLKLAVEEVKPEITAFTHFLDRDEGFIICDDRNGGIECGVHGHAGPNGARGNPRAFSRLGRKYNLGHYHSAGIADGVYWGGTCGKLDPDWTTGPGGWSQSHVITYVNGKRAIITAWKGKWKA